MKVNRSFVLREVGGQCVAVPVGRSCKTFRGVIKLNDTARLVWESVLAGDSEEQTVSKMLDQYDVTVEHAHSAYRNTVERMREIGAVSEDV
ncbi:MAG: PqqD family protein [Lachnospiraceae bacterium]|nr:PqqD family protein [Lachnospiraceae bacterium]